VRRKLDVVNSASIEPAQATASPSWAEVARAVHRELSHGQTRDAGAAIEPLRLGVFWLAAAPGNAGVEGVAALYGEWSEADWESALRVAEAEGLHTACAKRRCRAHPRSSMRWRRSCCATVSGID